VRSSSSSISGDPSLDDVAVDASGSATSREWVLAPVLEQVLPDMVDAFLSSAKGRSKVPKNPVDGMKKQKSKQVMGSLHAHTALEGVIDLTGESSMPQGVMSSLVRTIFTLHSSLP
jgi:hypothetical protein